MGPEEGLFLEGKTQFSGGKDLFPGRGNHSGRGLTHCRREKVFSRFPASNSGRKKSFGPRAKPFAGAAEFQRVGLADIEGIHI